MAFDLDPVQEDIPMEPSGEAFSIFSFFTVYVIDFGNDRSDRAETLQPLGDPEGTLGQSFSL
jgi:hypothetical protein